MIFEKNRKSPNKLSRAGAALLAAGSLAIAGFLAGSNSDDGERSVVKAPVCEPAAQIAQIIKHVRNGDTFEARAIKSKKADDLMTVAPKHSQGFESINNPLVIMCGSKIMEYVGLTTKANDTPGTPHKISEDLYLNVAEPADVTVVPTTSVKGQFHEQPRVHPGMGTSIPGFVEQPVPAGASHSQVAERAFGMMLNGL